MLADTQTSSVQAGAARGVVFSMPARHITSGMTVEQKIANSL